MSAPTPANKIQVASISDRGLSDKRPLNEDSLLVDAARGIFAVADGVGGAEAGEVASQTAIDVLNEAFSHRIGDGDDAEDLMELAIQRANNSIHHMSVEQPRFSMMATTIVALHLDGYKATFGHVGDSRLYRLTPDGKLNRETQDHSIVEEEVRAGRMTPQQAANHPSKNVISRALGAEESVEVDMKTIEIQDGTTFLLCTDGITRHVADNELRELLLSGQAPEAICTEMKERCYQRGAEDNLTAVIVEIGTPKHVALTTDDERTADRFAPVPGTPVNAPADAALPLTAPSRIAFPGPAPETRPQVNRNTIPITRNGRGTGRAVLRFFVFLLFLVVAAAAFYGGVFYQKRLNSAENAAASQTNQTSPVSDRATDFERKRSAVDSDPQKWMNDNLPLEFAKEGIPRATDSKDPEFLYLYGRALMLTGNHRDAAQAFSQAVNNLRAEPSSRLPLSAELKLAEASAALKLRSQAGTRQSQESLMAEQKAASLLDELLGLNAATPAK